MPMLGAICREGDRLRFHSNAHRTVRRSHDRMAGIDQCCRELASVSATSRAMVFQCEAACSFCCFVVPKLVASGAGE